MMLPNDRINQADTPQCANAIRQFSLRMLAVIAFCWSGLLAGQTTSAEDREPRIDFASQVRPLLSDRCFSCHGPAQEHREADLRIDDLDSMLEDRGGYQVLQPGSADDSELIRRILSDDPDEVMPPPEMGKSLTADEEQAVIKWVEQGATWSQHWAYEAPTQAAIPSDQVSQNLQRRSRNWIDIFVAAKLEERGAHFAPRADLVTLARRLSFDLTGLPPTENEMLVVEQSGASQTAALDAYTERLLASPAFGERMAAYWLDLVRFADTVGYHGDQDHNISPYRDYVINAFNDNKSFAQFTIEQLAGDLLPNASDEQIVATGYNRLLQTSHEGGVQPKEYLAIYSADRVRNASAVWMGATLGCAQCHDHKYDPFSAHDFYSFAAFFADVDEAQHFKVGSNNLPTKRPPEKPFLSRAELLLVEQLDNAVTQLECELESLESQSVEDSAAADNVNDKLQSLREQIQALRDEAKEINESARVSMITVSTTPREIRYLPRGNWLDDSGDVMQPAVPEFLGEVELNDRERATRLDLANWLVDTESGAGLLTARVFVNRVWLLLFGHGLSRSEEDFGGQGEPPTHPALLDRLSIEFVQSGWDVKRLVRLITSSEAYRQSSLESSWQIENDPENRWLSRQNRYRVPAETVRDIVLQNSGLLVSQVGGSSVKPYQPTGYYRHLNFPTRKYKSSGDYGQWRRGLYVHWQRQFLHPMLRAFDAPTREECTAQRTQSNTPLAALVWLNDPSFIEAARIFAERILKTNLDGDSARLGRLFQLSTSRRPDDAELEQLSQLLHHARSAYADDAAAAEALTSVGLSQTTDRFPVTELAAWTMVTRAVLNLSEVYTRN